MALRYPPQGMELPSCPSWASSSPATMGLVMLCMMPCAKLGFVVLFHIESFPFF